MIEPIGYKLNPEKLKKAPQGILPYVVGTFYYTEDYEYFDVIEPYLDVPKPRKSLEEISQEFDEKIDKLIEDTKTKFYGSKIYADSKYEKKFDKIFDNFEYAKEHGQFPLELILDYSKLIATGPSYISSNFTIKSGGEEVGYYTTGDGYLRYSMNKKPNAITRWFMKTLLDFRWVDK